MKTHKHQNPFRKLAIRVGLGVLIVGTGGTLMMANTVAAESPTSVVGLRLGSKGYSVAVVQQALQAHGFPPPGGVDGTFGAGTDQQVRAFQKSQGLNESGEIDASTAAALGLSDSSGSASSTPKGVSKSTPKATPSANTSSVEAWTGLTSGSSGSAVSNVQARLVELGVAVDGGVDGHYGKGTAAAVAAYQTSLGINSTGSIDQATAQALIESRPYTAASAPAPAPAPLPSMVGLQVGSTGDAVKDLQKRLSDAGISVGGGADGIYGALTAAAVRTYQSASGLPATGAVDQATADAIAALAPGTSLQLSGLAPGSKGAAVIRLQNLLVAANIQVAGGVDGSFGPATETAVRSYQTGIGVNATGVVDDATATSLLGGNKVSLKKAEATPLVGLQAGALGTVVTELQNKLVKVGVRLRGGADGIFGPATTTAVKTFQTSQGLPSTGVVDQATLDALANPKTITPSPGTPSSGDYPAYGEQSSRVVSLQKALSAAGFTVGGGNDGQFGAKTTAAVMAFQKQNGLAVTGKVDQATANALSLAAAAKPADPAPSGISIKVFPVQPTCGYVDTWGAARSGGRSHIGVDVLAPEGNELYAVADGTITKVYTDYPGALAGNGVRLTMADGTYFFYAHMSRLADGIGVGTPVTAGQVIGYVGATGNAGVSHLHFEAHPGGGSAVNPYSILKAVNAC